MISAVLTFEVGLDAAENDVPQLDSSHLRDTISTANIPYVNIPMPTSYMSLNLTPSTWGTLGHPSLAHQHLLPILPTI